MRPLTDTVPKSLVEVRGESLLERHLKNIRDAGIEDVVINLGWLGDKIVERVGSGAEYGLNVDYSPEGENILETGGGIHNALPMLGDEPFLVVNADITPTCRCPMSLWNTIWSVTWYWFVRLHIVMVVTLILKMA